MYKGVYLGGTSALLVVNVFEPLNVEINNTEIILDFSDKMLILHNEDIVSTCMSTSYINKLRTFTINTNTDTYNIGIRNTEVL